MPSDHVLHLSLFSLDHFFSFERFHLFLSIYILGDSAQLSADLKRPFPKPKGFMDQIADAQKAASGAPPPKEKPNKAANLALTRKNK
jgi:hypothetical protein